ncbi:MAG: hypothetical protein ACRCYX_12835 [Dermatophilaceae bacterium]
MATYHPAPPLPRPLRVDPPVRHWVLVLSGLVLAISLGIAAVGLTVPHYVWVSRIARYPSLWLTGGVSTACVLVATAGRHRSLRRAAVAIGSAALPVALVVAWYVAAFPPFGSWAPMVRPDGRAEAVVVEDAAIIDPLWIVWVRQPTGLTARQWPAACLNGDDPANSLVSVAWSDPTTLAVRVNDGRTLEVDTDPTSGEPQQMVTTGDPYACPS